MARELFLQSCEGSGARRTKVLGCGQYSSNLFRSRCKYLDKVNQGGSLRIMPSNGFVIRNRLQPTCACMKALHAGITHSTSSSNFSRRTTRTLASLNQADLVPCHVHRLVCGTAPTVPAPAGPPAPPGCWLAVYASAAQLATRRPPASYVAHPPQCFLIELHVGSCASQDLTIFAEAWQLSDSNSWQLIARDCTDTCLVQPQ